MLNYKKLLFLLAIAWVQPIFADDEKTQFIMTYDEHANITGINALVGITEFDPSCDQRIASVVVDEIVYDGDSDTIVGFRAQKPGPRPWYGIFRIDHEQLFNALGRPAQVDLQKLVHKRAPLIVIYQVCGSAGIISVREIFAKGALNNP